MGFYKRKFWYVFCVLAYLSLNGFVFASGKVVTDVPGVFAYANSRGYYHQIKSHDFPIIHEDPLPASFYGFGGKTPLGFPLTNHNNWPEKLSNASIFPYLARHPSVNPGRYDEVCAFVNDWYQSSCAIVYSSSTGTEIVGSGSLVGNGLVSTARHNFEHIPAHHLFARFFRYSVVPTPYVGVLWVQEHYLDVPVMSTYRAINGLDAGCLGLPFLDPKLFSQYARVLPIQASATDGFLSSGEYGMFHFAGGSHQISVGEVRPCTWGSWLHNDIAVQGGPGSSGAVVIGKWLGRVQGCGVSIYRQVQHDWGTSVERRLISFAHFTNVGATLDPISAPYYYSPHFYVSSTNPFSESGYEFLRWKLAYTREGNDHPNLPMFAHTEANHSNHHIIPRGDLLYLWNYAHDVPTFQPIMDRLRGAIDIQVTKESLVAKKKEAPFNAKQRADALYDQHLAVYGRLRRCISGLYITFYDCHGRYQVMNESIGFYWAGWNLFKGWNEHYRSDDPLHDGEDRSEKTKPKGFNKGLWSCLKDPKTGLYQRIQELKQATLKGVPDVGLLLQIEQSLLGIRELLDKNSALKLPHPYNLAEWEPRGVGLYRVRR